MGPCRCKLAQGTPSCKAFPAITVVAREHGRPKPCLPRKLPSWSRVCRPSASSTCSVSMAQQYGGPFGWGGPNGENEQDLPGPLLLSEGLWQTLQSLIKTAYWAGFMLTDKTGHTDKRQRKKCTTLVSSLGIVQSFVCYHELPIMAIQPDLCRPLLPLAYAEYHNGSCDQQLSTPQDLNVMTGESTTSKITPSASVNGRVTTFKVN